MFDASSEQLRLLVRRATNATVYFRDLVKNVTTAGLYYVAVWPLRKLYFEGPSLHGYAFWQSKDPADACAELTSVSAEHWRLHPDACERLLEQKFHSFGVGVAFSLYACVIAAVVAALIIRCCLVRPLVTAVERRDSQPIVDKKI